MGSQSRLVFDFPENFWTLQDHKLQCASLVKSYFERLEGFPCSYVPGDPDDWGIFATSRSTLTNRMLLTLIIFATQAELLFNIAVLAFLSLFIRLAWMVQKFCRSMVATRRGSTSCLPRRGAGPPIAAASGRHPPAGKDSADSSVPPSLASGRRQHRGGRMNFCFVFAVAVAVLLGVAWIAAGCFWFYEFWSKLSAMTDSTCRLADGDFSEGPRPTSSASLFSREVYALRSWLHLPELGTPRRSCWVSLQRRLPCEHEEDSGCWAPFSTASNQTEVLFSSDGTDACSGLVRFYQSFRSGFSCTFLPDGALRWAVLAESKASLQRASVLDAVRLAASRGAGACSRYAALVLNISTVCIDLVLLRVLWSLTVASWSCCRSRLKRAGARETDGTLAAADAVYVALPG